MLPLVIKYLITVNAFVLEEDRSWFTNYTILVGRSLLAERYHFSDVSKLTTLLIKTGFIDKLSKFHIWVTQVIAVIPRIVLAEVIVIAEIIFRSVTASLVNTNTYNLLNNALFTSEDQVWYIAMEWIATRTSLAHVPHKHVFKQFLWLLRWFFVLHITKKDWRIQKRKYREVKQKDF